MVNNLQDLLKKTSVPATVLTEPKDNASCSSNINSATSIKNDDTALFLENIEDRKTNRDQREKIAKKIFIMMAWEVSVTGILLFGIFVVPFLNALAPTIKINLPPVFFTLSIVVGYLFIVRYIDLLPCILVSCKRLHIKKTAINISAIIKTFAIITIFILINFLPRKSYVFNFEQIQLSENITNLILYTAVTVFAKTTYLGHCIIKSLYELMKNHKLN